MNSFQEMLADKFNQVNAVALAGLLTLENVEMINQVAQGFAVTIGACAIAAYNVRKLIAQNKDIKDGKAKDTAD
jgi:hypothetical protein